jgi:hypothetical protein
MISSTRTIFENLVGKSKKKCLGFDGKIILRANLRKWSKEVWAGFI